METFIKVIMWWEIVAALIYVVALARGTTVTVGRGALAFSLIVVVVVAGWAASILYGR